MSLKSLLNLEDFPIREEEIIQKLQEAYAQHKENVEFTHRGKRVKVKVSPLRPEGLMRGIFDYYSNN